jgi:hypothetical protein
VDRKPLPGLATTAIGSLPYTQLELALQQAFLVDIPYLPQLPLRDPAEYMVPQALDGMPGLRHDREGNATLELDVWRKGWLDARLERAIDRGDGLSAFEPRPAACAAWRPFVWEVEQRRAPFAKAHLAGPTTLRWALRTTDGRRLSELPDGAEIEAQILRLVMAKGLAMAQRLREAGATPVIFLDEPGLVAFERGNGRHIVALQELRVVILALQHAGAHVGVHCCGNTDWASLLQLPWDLVSLDARLSLGPVLEAKEALGRYVASGGAFALGLVPTNIEPVGAALGLDAVVDGLLTTVPALLEQAAPGLLRRCLVTPACGLAMRTVSDAEQILDTLRRAQRALL